MKPDMAKNVISGVVNGRIMFYVICLGLRSCFYIKVPIQTFPTLGLKIFLDKVVRLCVRAKFGHFAGIIACFATYSKYAAKSA